MDRSAESRPGPGWKVTAASPVYAAGSGARALPKPCPHMASPLGSSPWGSEPQIQAQQEPPGSPQSLWRPHQRRPPPPAFASSVRSRNSVCAWDCSPPSLEKALRSNLPTWGCPRAPRSCIRGEASPCAAGPTARVQLSGLHLLIRGVCRDQMPGKASPWSSRPGRSSPPSLVLLPFLSAASVRKGERGRGNKTGSLTSASEGSGP